ncbi:MAG: HlyC/CorC family transporter [Gammaproteobacteria bacterium]|nr:HlyC/CorC family transporter [Pseudomonadota bacterium]MCZ6731303.1 HlyC/CorC family transporter [Gammaproteobacteria bacterium]TDJ72490.1 MAG: HlyC/CorC family transporter [Pseudomonadota bacterium]
MDDVPIGALAIALTLLILLSAFFSASEIGMMALNRYRLKHLAESGHRAARIAHKLLERPDRVLGVILLGNNFANLAASAVTTIIALKIFGEASIAVATALLTITILIFAEVAPKTIAAMQPERVAFPAAYVLRFLLKVCYPIIWLINQIVNQMLRLLGVPLDKRGDQISTEELRLAVMDAGTLIPKTHQAMLLGILDLEKITVEDVMVPRGQIQGIDFDDDWDDILAQLTRSRYTRLAIYRGSLENVIGMIHMRKVLNGLRENKLSRETLIQSMTEPYFIPEGTPLNTQLLNFKKTKRRIGFVVDEYGDIMGLVTLDEILEEIVGDFSTEAIGKIEDIRPQADGSYLVKGGASIRDLNRKLGWELPSDGSRTINGLITEYLEDIPAPGTSLMLNGYQVDVMRTRGTAVEVARIRPYDNPVAAEEDSSS